MIRGSRSAIALVVVPTATSLAPTTLFSSCTDTDGDGYFFSEGWGNLRDRIDAKPESFPGTDEFY